MDTIANLLEQARSYAHELPSAPPALTIPDGRNIAGWIDHTLLKPEATPRDIQRLCQEARQAKFATVCVNPAYAQLAAGLLAGSSVQVCVVIAFPFGATSPTLKTIETLACLSAGASEIDMVINLGAIKSQAFGLVFNEIGTLAQLVHNQRGTLKVIIETAILTQEEKIIACLISKAAQADYVKTSTGYNIAGATVQDVELMRRVVGDTMGVKAAGGIRNLETALAMIHAGASRIGTSAGMQILNEAVELESKGK